MSKHYSKIFTLAVLLVLGFFLNPTADKHRAKIKEAIAERSQMSKVFGLGHLTAFASRYHDLVVASYTTVDDDVQSVGVLGVVFVME